MINFQQNKKATNMRTGGGLQMGQPNPMRSQQGIGFPTQAGSAAPRDYAQMWKSQFPQVYNPTSEITGMRSASASAESFAKLLETFRTNMIGRRDANSIRRY